MGLDLSGVPVRLDSVRLLGELPEGLAPERALFPDRSHEQAEYLLDPLGRRAIESWAERERSVPYRIVHGDEPFADHAAGVQGVPWRCSTAAFLAEAAATIDAIDLGAVRGRFSVADMADLGLYKVDPGEADSDAFTRIAANLRRLAAHYREIADQGLDLVLVLD